MGWKGNRNKTRGLISPECGWFYSSGKLPAGGFLGREVNKSGSAYKGLSALMQHSSLAAVRLPVIHPTLLLVPLDSIEVTEGFVTPQTYENLLLREA